jgi:hypothetical protein
MAEQSSVAAVPYRQVIGATTLGDHVDTVLAWLVIAVCDVAIRCAGYPRTWRLVEWLRGRVATADNRRLASARRIQGAVDRASPYYVSRVPCLLRSTATIVLLRVHGIRANLVFGVQRAPFAAHAWVELGDELVNEIVIRRNGYVVIHRS